MRKIGEVLRLKAVGMNIREIARSTGVGKTTVYEYLARAQATGLGWPLPLGLDEAGLEEKLFPPASAELAASRPVPDWREVHRELKRGRHVTLRLLWLEMLPEETIVEAVARLGKCVGAGGPSPDRVQLRFQSRFWQFGITHLVAAAL